MPNSSAKVAVAELYERNLMPWVSAEESDFFVEVETLTRPWARVERDQVQVGQLRVHECRGPLPKVLSCLRMWLPRTAGYPSPKVEPRSRVPT